MNTTSGAGEGPCLDIEKRLTPPTRNALRTVFDSTNGFGFVPLLDVSLRPKAKGAFKPTGVVLTYVQQDNDRFGLSIDVVPPPNTTAGAFAETCLELNEPLLDVRFVIDLGEFVVNAAAAGPVVTGAIQMENDASNTGYIGLVVPRYYQHRGYDMVAAKNPDVPEIHQRSREEAATLISASMLDHFLQTYLTMNPG
jgi:hypothetical protein